MKEKEIQRLQTKLSKLDPDNASHESQQKKAPAKKASAKPKEAAKAEEKKDTQKLADPKAE